ncbi:MAG: serine hydrolase, partial [Acidobacteria bacterium]|nr:serine hydrolase [Acidobacteriota bacterium]
ETVEQMYTKQKLRDGKEIDYGLGWGLASLNGRRYVMHTGAQQRVSTLLYTIPDEGAAVAIMVNVEDTQLSALAGQIAKALRK